MNQVHCRRILIADIAVCTICRRTELTIQRATRNEHRITIFNSTNSQGFTPKFGIVFLLFHHL